MSPAQVDLALTVLRLLSESIQKRLTQHNELLALFENAQEEGRDFTEEEIAIFKLRSEKALAELEEVIDGL